MIKKTVFVAGLAAIGVGVAWYIVKWQKKEKVMFVISFLDTF